MVHIIWIISIICVINYDVSIKMIIQERALVPRPSSGLVSCFPKHFGDPSSDFADLASTNKIDENTKTEMLRNK